MGPKKKGKKKKSAKNEAEEKAKAEEEEKAAERERAAERLRIQQEEEAAAKILAEKIAKAKSAMLDVFERDKMVVLPDDIVKPFEMWTAYEETKEGIWHGIQAGVEPTADEFTKLRSRADEEKAILSRFDYSAHLESLKNEPQLGSHNGPKVDGVLDQDERFLQSLWNETGGSTGSWKRTKGWKHIGNWVELCEKWEPEVRILQPPLKKGEVLAVTIDEIVKNSIPNTEGVVVHRSRIQNISLFANNLIGRIPTNVGLLTHLKILNLHGNSLSGPIPASLTRCNILQHLDLCRNSLTGPLPKGFADLSQLKHLHLEHNVLTGPLPKSFSKMIYLKEFTGHHNKFNGRLPCDLGECRALTLLSLHHNRLTGFLPESLTQCTKLKQLLLVKNKLIGSVPASLYSGCDITSTPRSGIQLKCQVFPSKTPDSDSETESIVAKAAQQGGDYDGQYYEEQYNEGTEYDEYLGYAGEYGEGGGGGGEEGGGEYIEQGDQNVDYEGQIVSQEEDYNEAYDGGYEAEDSGEAVAQSGYAADGNYGEADGYYDEQGNWVQGYYDEYGNWVDTQQDWSGEATGY
mmetsp:Transcript_44810/g.57393  ORF Transcript_44810/g.57393 Transcript_44810/m.57393 type:complete len:573 (-) Transcript_44810:64-1782(-)